MDRFHCEDAEPSAATCSALLNIPFRATCTLTIAYKAICYLLLAQIGHDGFFLGGVSRVLGN